MAATHSYGYYGATFQQYEALRFTGIAGRWSHRRQEAIIAHVAKKWPAKKVLEIGCGTGRCTRMLLDAGCTVTAIEPAFSMLMEAKNRCKDDLSRGKVTFINTDIDGLGCLRDRFDAIILVNVFSRLPHAERALDTLSDVLGEEGQLVFNFQCITSVLLPFALAVNRRRKSLSRAVFSFWYKPSQVKSLLRGNHMTIKEWIGHHYVPVPRLLFWSLPALWLVDATLGRYLPKISPSLFVRCVKKQR